MSVRRRRIVTQACDRLRAIVFLGLLSIATVASATGPTALPVEGVADDYVRPHQRIEVEPGRRMHLHCMGEGAPTVVFDAGLSDWSSTWALIQPAVATRTRACSYDRAGMGDSDPASRPATPANAVRDLHALLAGAGIDGPLLLVGHSLGGFNMKLYAATYPQQVAGLVLVDPTEERLWARVGPVLAPRFGQALVRDARDDDTAGIRELVDHFRDCARDTRAGKLDDARYAQCTDPVRVPLGPVILAERKQLQATVAYQDAQATEIAACPYVPDADLDAGYAALFDGKHPFGDKPVVVLTHSLWDMTPPLGEIGYNAYVVAHRQTAALSTRGTQRMVPMSRHNIQIDQPQAVIDAVADVLDALKAH